MGQPFAADHSATWCRCSSTSPWVTSGRFRCGRPPWPHMCGRFPGPGEEVAAVVQGVARGNQCFTDRRLGSDLPVDVGGPELDRCIVARAVVVVEPGPDDGASRQAAELLADALLTVGRAVPRVGC